MSKTTDMAWKLLEQGDDIETVRLRTGLSRAVLEAMLKDIDHQKTTQWRQTQ